MLLELVWQKKVVTMITIRSSLKQVTFNLISKTRDMALAPDQVIYGAIGSEFTLKDKLC